ncbi:MAG: transposase family protein [Firmicutes bacterium]|jgi:transposase|nr:transposase family protein [Bacillota bacterium]
MSGWIIPKDVPLAFTVIVGDATPIIIRGQMTNSAARCPQCGTPSGPIHSAYWRTVQDLPWRTVPVPWLLRCRRFWCPNPACARTLFCERLPTAWVAARQRRTMAVWTHLTTWGWTASAADVARVATGQGLSVSPDTIIRALRRAPDPPMGDLRMVGVDEWALRKGRT